jgi:hypothetical protein
MELINATRMVAGYNMGLEPSGRELLVVVIKGTFVVPKPGEQMRLAGLDRGDLLVRQIHKIDQHRWRVDPSQLTVLIRHVAHCESNTVCR